MKGHILAKKSFFLSFVFQNLNGCLVQANLRNSFFLFLIDHWLFMSLFSSFQRLASKEKKTRTTLQKVRNSFLLIQFFTERIRLNIFLMEINAKRITLDHFFPFSTIPNLYHYYHSSTSNFNLQIPKSILDR